MGSIQPAGSPSLESRTQDERGGRRCDSPHVHRSLFSSSTNSPPTRRCRSDESWQGSDPATRQVRQGRVLPTCGWSARAFPSFDLDPGKVVELPDSIGKGHDLHLPAMERDATERQAREARPVRSLHPRASRRDRRHCLPAGTPWSGLHRYPTSRRPAQRKAPPAFRATTGRSRQETRIRRYFPFSERPARYEPRRGGSPQPSGRDSEARASQDTPRCLDVGWDRAASQRIRPSQVA